MNVSEKFREMSIDELKEKDIELKRDLFNLRFQHGTHRLENVAKLGTVRRDIARIKTIIREKQINTGSHSFPQR